MALHEDILSRPTSMALHKDILSRLKCMALHRDIFSVGSRVWPYIKFFFGFLLYIQHFFKMQYILRLFLGHIFQASVEESSFLK